MSFGKLESDATEGIACAQQDEADEPFNHGVGGLSPR